MTDENTSVEVPAGEAETVTTPEDKQPETTNDASNDTATEPDKAPSKAPADTDTPAEDTPETTKTMWEEYTPSGDESGDLVSEMLMEAGVTKEQATEIFKDAIESNDPSKINKEALVEHLGEKGAKVALALAKDYYTRSIGTIQAEVKAIHEAAGGESQFNALMSWANEAAKTGNTEKFAQINKLFDMGGDLAKLGVQELTRLYNADPKNRSLQVNFVQGDSTVKSGMETISRADYVRDIKEAHRKGDAAEINRLNELRLRSMG